MSRKYLNNRWCVRCNKREPTPYLKKNLKLLPTSGRVLDIGCGNGRNSEYMFHLGYNVIPVDMAPPDFGEKIILGEDALPDFRFDILLANYVLMFLRQHERISVMYQMHTRAAMGACLVIEMYPAKDAYEYDFDEIVEFYLDRGWTKLRKSIDKCVLRKDYEMPRTGHTVLD